MRGKGRERVNVERMRGRKESECIASVNVVEAPAHSLKPYTTTNHHSSSYAYAHHHDSLSRTQFLRPPAFLVSLRLHPTHSGLKTTPLPTVPLVLHTLYLPKDAVIPPQTSTSTSLVPTRCSTLDPKVEVCACECVVLCVCCMWGCVVVLCVWFCVCGRVCVWVCVRRRLSMCGGCVGTW